MDQGAIQSPVNSGQNIPSGRGKKVAIGIVVVVIILAIAAAGGYAFYKNWQRQSLVTSIFNALDVDNYQYAYNTSTAELKKNLKDSEMLALNSLALSEQAELTYALDPSEKGNYQVAAIGTGKQAVTADPNNSDAWLAEGYASFANQDFDQAHTDFQKALALNPKNARAALYDGDSMYFKGDLDSAIKSYTQALTLNSSLAEAHIGLGRSYNLQNNSNQAVTEFQKALTLAKDGEQHAEANYELGMIALNTGMLTDAKTYLTQATTVDPSYAYGWYGYGMWQYATAMTTSASSSQQQNQLAVFNSMASLGKAETIDPLLTLPKIQIAYEMIELNAPGSRAAAPVLLGAAEQYLSQDTTLNAQQRTNAESRIALFKSMAANK